MVSEGETDQEEAESDAVAAEREWHTWLLGALVVLGGAIVVLPDSQVPELVIDLGPTLIAMGVVGWVIQRVVRSRR